MRRRLLVVARDVNLRATLARWLAPAGFAIELAEGARRAREVLDAGEIAAGILRIERSDAAILPIARELRDAGGRLIVVLDEAPAKGQSMRYRLDADAFLREPLTEQAVVERIKAVLAPIEAREKAPGRPETLKIDGMTLDLSGHSLVDAAGRQVRLTRGEFALLSTFARHPGRVLSRDRLLDAVSGRSAGTFDRSIDNMVARLRRKIERDAKKPSSRHYRAGCGLPIRRAIAGIGRPITARRGRRFASRASLRQSRRRRPPFSCRGRYQHHADRRARTHHRRDGSR